MLHHRKFTAISLALAAFLLQSGLPRAEEAQPEARSVLWVTARAEHSGLLDFAGKIQPRVEADLAFRTLGRVVSRNVKLGDIVRKGDVLMAVDPLALELAVRSTEAEVRSAQAQLQNAQTIAERNQILVTSKSASQADLEVAEQSLIAAQANLDRANSSLDKAREQLTYATLKADFDGAITATAANVGQTVAVGQTVLTLAGLEQRDAVVDVPEALLTPIRSAPDVTVELQLDPTISTSGTLREIAPEADATTRTYRVKIAIDKAPPSFRLGSVATVRFSADMPSEAIRLPASAVFDEEGKHFVWRIDKASNAVRKTEIDIGSLTAQTVLVTVKSGLSLGDRIVAAGVDQIKDGQIVKLGQERRT
ncbi:efflux RND transporter periplasmic adaptor subunit [Rhizobium sp. FY34]|uniref:efflux RND transporter periplasmic adaptor subunit n=1 Tax=Rhizobium sp. FY34 TaxID=2562309 RepID=UPI0010BF8F20|nr:efflux RND transporter periplasmic adaptor subunit [Rhizobium sp. FY34]